MRVQIFCGHPDFDNSATHQFLKAALPDGVGFTQMPSDWDAKAVAAQQEKLLAAERVFLQFPLYWYQAPWLVSRWCEQVLTDEVVARLQQDEAPREFGVIVSIGQPRVQYQPGGREAVSLVELLKPYEALAHRLHMTYLPPFVVAQHSYQTESEQMHTAVAFQMALLLPKNANFATRTRWCIEQLKARPPKDPALKQQTEALLDDWEQRLAEWETLRDDVPPLSWR